MGSPTSIPYYIDGFKVTRGVCLYGDAFSPPTTVPTAAANQAGPYTVVSLTHFDDGNNSTAFTDATGNTFWTTPHGAAKEVLTPVKFGTGSGQFLLDADYLSSAAVVAGQNSVTDYAWAQPDFTFEGFIYPLDVTGGVDHVWFDMRATAPASGTPGFRIRQRGTVLNVDVGNYFTPLTSASGVIPAAGQWYHVAFVRYGFEEHLYVNGVQVASSTGTGNYLQNPTGGTFYMGSTNGGAGLSADGYIDEVRFIKGLAVYKANFTPPTAPYTALSVTPIPLKEIHFRRALLRRFVRRCRVCRTSG